MGSGDEVRVDTDDLRGKAGQIEGITWPNQGAQPQLIPPDTLREANTAILNLDSNAQGLWNFQEYGRLEGLRLAETLKLVAGAYDLVDTNAMADINNGGEGTSPPEVPGVNKLPAPPLPKALEPPAGQLVDDGLMVPDVQTNLLAGDQAASLRAAAATWRQNAESLQTAAEEFEVSTVNWEGEAAKAAYRKFNDYRSWLSGLSSSWHSLADEADRVAQAHFNTLSKHQPIFDEYMRLQSEFLASAEDPGKAAKIAERMSQLQKDSEDVRWQYAREGQPTQVEPEEPPRGTAPTAPVTSNGDPRQPARPGGDGQPQAPGGAQSPGGSGGQPPASPAVPQSPTASPASAQGEGKAPGGAPSGGGQPSEGGKPSGGGAPSGGGPGEGGSGGGGPQTGGPKLPTDPSLRPAAAGGGGSGSGGGGGGGVGSSPMTGAVTAETVAPAPMVGAGPGPSTGAAVSSGAMAGGMGGMAPMHGAGMGGQQQEKKRNPAVAQDEELYTEDRPWTEAVIGNRRRRGTPEEKES